MRVLNFGILGVSGHFIKRVLVPVRKVSSINLYGIASRSIDKSKAVASRFGISQAYGSYQEMLDDPGIDCVYIPLPNHLHMEWIMKAAEAGKDILCEKPLAMDAAQTQEAISYTQQKGRIIMEAFMYKFHPQWLRVKELIDIGEIGNITSIHTFFTYHNPDAGNIRNIAEYGGGAMMDIGCYAVSVPRFLLGREPEKVLALIQNDETFKTDKLSSALMDFGSCQASFTVGTQTYPYQKVMIHGSSGNISVEIPFNTFPDVPAEVVVDTKIGRRTIRFEAYDHYGNQFEAFANAVLKREPAPISPMDAINNMRVIDAIRQSAGNGQWVNL